MTEKIGSNRDSFDANNSANNNSSKITASQMLSNQIEEGLQYSRKKHYEALEEIKRINSANNFIDECKQLEIELHKALSLFQEYADAIQTKNDPLKIEKYSSFNLLDVLEEEINQAEESLRQHVNDILKKYKPIGLDELDLGFFFDNKNNLLDCKCNIEILLNRIINEKLYLSQLVCFLNINKQKILDIFIENKLDKKPLYSKQESNDNSIRIEEVSFIDPGAEGHNRGKKPVYAKLVCKNFYIEFVCKPRNAGIDAAVIETFKNINALPMAYKSSPVNDLPIYFILSLDDKNNSWKYLKELGEISIWEFVSGEKVHGASARIFIEDLKEKHSLAPKLRRLDGVLYAMGVIDLHSDNVLYVKNRKGSQIVPIDLEVRHQGVKTRLGAEGNHFPLTKEEKACIDKFHKKTSQINFRVVPISTLNLAKQITNYKSIEYLPQLIMDSFIRDGYIMENSISNIKRFVTIDVLNCDVPYFTELDNNLYYGSVKDERRIGLKKGVKK